MQHLQERQAWREQVTAALDAVNRTAMENSESLRAIAAAQKEADTRAAQHAGLAKLEAQLAQLAREYAAQAYNLEQVRL